MDFGSRGQYKGQYKGRWFKSCWRRNKFAFHYSSWGGGTDDMVGSWKWNFTLSYCRFSTKPMPRTVVLGKWNLSKNIFLLRIQKKINNNKMPKKIILTSSVQSTQLLVKIHNEGGYMQTLKLVSSGLVFQFVNFCCRLRKKVYFI